MLYPFIIAKNMIGQNGVHGVAEAATKWIVVIAVKDWQSDVITWPDHHQFETEIWEPQIELYSNKWVLEFSSELEAQEYIRDWWASYLEDKKLFEDSWFDDWNDAYKQ